MNRILDRRLPCVETRTVISPDGDGSNETFLINCIQEFPGNRISIYNRAGQLVFQTQNYNNDWRGTTQSGEPLPEGPYYFILEYKDREQKDVRVEGSITLLRGE
jgi:gliding motility-associated-like protein